MASQSKPNKPNQSQEKCNSRLTVGDEDISRISYPFASGGAIVAPVVSVDVKGMLFERLKGELLPKLNGSWKRGCNIDHFRDDDKVEMTVAETVVRSRLVIGIKQCTRMLEKLLQQKKLNKFTESKHPMPSLIILTRDVRPSTIFSHIPIFAHFLKVPVLILPGKASIEFGRLFGIKSIAAIMFLSRSTIQSEGTDEEELDAQMDVDSFVNFAISKIPKK